MDTTTDPVLLVLGAGPRIGASVAQSFAKAGYKIVLVSRTGKNETTSEGYLSLGADLSKPESVPGVFRAVQTEFHAFPSVVIYNAAARTAPPNQDSMFSMPADSIASDLNINTISAYVAAQQAVIGWTTLRPEQKKTFIYTGNPLNVFILPRPITLNLGMGKSASAYWIGLADSIYSNQGMRFFYADERQADGKSKGAELDSEAHGEFYTHLATHDIEVPWHATFVRDKGYMHFE